MIPAQQNQTDSQELPSATQELPTENQELPSATQELPTENQELPSATQELPTTSRLIIFARYPQPGKTKTRLIPALGEQGAADVHQSMTQRMLEVADTFAASRDISVVIWFAGGSRKEMSSLYGEHRTYIEQPTGSLGDKMEIATADAFAQGVKKVVIVGTDCPDLDSLTLHAAFEELRDTPVVLGPAHDGGYYLIGLSVNSPTLFRNIQWGSKHVLKQTLKRANNASLSTVTLHELADVDIPSDLPVWERASKNQPDSLTLSIIIPTLNEECEIEHVLAAIQTASDAEVIVCDGGSTDRTCEIAASLGAVVISSALGRGAQMNMGATIASGALLLFLHADTLLPPNFDAHVLNVLADPKVAAGAFRFGSDSSSSRMRLIQVGANLRSTYIGMPYGDQAIFLRASTFNTVGGFPPIPIMEDIEFILRARKLGRIAIALASVQTSSRRWQQHGILRTSIKNLCCATAYLAGVSPERIASWRGRR